MIISLFSVVLVSAACGAAQPVATAMPLTPTPVPPTATAAATATATLSPAALAALNTSPRGWVTMAYDAELDRVILFGGVTGNPQSADYTAPDDTWAYDVTATK